MTTIVVAFTDAWLIDVTEPDVTVHTSHPDRKSATSVGGEIRSYAGGRNRVITSANTTATFPLTLQLVNDDELELLTLWRGRVLLLRDGQGRRVFGTFLSLDVDDYWDPTGPLHNVSLTFTELTYSEAV